MQSVLEQVWDQNTKGIKCTNDYIYSQRETKDSTTLTVTFNQCDFNGHQRLQPFIILAQTYRRTCHSNMTLLILQHRMVSLALLVSSHPCRRMLFSRTFSSHTRSTLILWMILHLLLDTTEKK